MELIDILLTDFWSSVHSFNEVCVLINNDMSTVYKYIVGDPDIFSADNTIVYLELKDEYKNQSAKVLQDIKLLYKDINYKYDMLGNYLRKMDSCRDQIKDIGGVFMYDSLYNDYKQYKAESFDRLSVFIYKDVKLLI